MTATKDPQLVAQAAFVKAQMEMPKVAKDATNPHFKNKYADLPGLFEAVLPVLHKHGFAVSQPTMRDSTGAAVLRTRLLHQDGGVIEDEGIPLMADKVNMQGLGSAVTYARRYGLGSLCGVITDIDDDGNAASNNGRSADTPATPSVSRATKGDSPF